MNVRVGRTYPERSRRTGPPHTFQPPATYNVAVPIPSAIRGQKYISLTTFRKNGVAVPTPIWFGEKDDKLYVMTRSDSGKYKRIKNNPKVRIAPCTMRGKITGPEFEVTARVLPTEDWPWAQESSRA